jgi:hypothetical protein
MLSILLIGALLDLGVSVAENPYNVENGLSVEEIVTIVKDAGWSDELIPEAVRVVLLESKGQPDKLQNDKGPGVGLFQIDLSVHWDKNPKENKMLKWFKSKGIKNRKEAVKWLQDSSNNAEAALQIWKDRDNFDESETGWEAWSVWNNGEIPEGREQKDWNIATKSMELALELLNNAGDTGGTGDIVEDVNYELVNEVPMGTSEQRQEYASQVPQEAGSYGSAQYRTLTGRKQKLSDNFAKLFETMMGAEPK